MKTTTHVLKLVLGVACAVALSVVSAANSNSAPFQQTKGHEHLDQDTVRGAVTAKTDASLTVNDKVITTTMATTFTKEGKAITLKEIQVGDPVKVVTSKSGEDKLQAVSVEVISKENKEGK